MLGYSYVGFKAWDMGFDAHLTVCYFGPSATVDTICEIDEIIKQPKWQGPAWVQRDSLALFGPYENVPVLRVTVQPELLELREELERFSVSKFLKWNPHITLDLDRPDVLHLPARIKLDDLGVY